MKNNWFDIPKKEDTGYGTCLVDVRTYDGKTKNIFHYTHDLFIATKFRRCRGLLTYGFVPPKRCLWEAHKTTCKGCQYAVETSLKERVSGSGHINLFMRWPAMCALSFGNVPVPDMPVSASELSRQYRIKRNFGYPPWSHPTVKKWLNGTRKYMDRIGRIAVLGPQGFIKLTSRYWIDYGSYLNFMFTPADLLLRKYPIEGTHALMMLSKVPKKWIPPGQTETVDFKPTRPNLIHVMDQKSFDLLNVDLSVGGVKIDSGARTSGILFRIKPIGVKQSELYFARPYFYRQYPELKRQYKDYQNKIYKLMISDEGCNFH